MSFRATATSRSSVRSCNMTEKQCQWKTMLKTLSIAMPNYQKMIGKCIYLHHFLVEFYQNSPYPRISRHDVTCCPLESLNFMFLYMNFQIPSTLNISFDLWESRSFTPFAFWWNSWMLSSKGNSGIPLSLGIQEFSRQKFLEFQQRNRPLDFLFMREVTKENREG